MTRAALVLVALVACKGDKSPAGLALVAEFRGEVTLIPGTDRIALRVGRTGWQEVAAGKRVDRPELGAAIARAAEAGDGVADIFLGTTPIVIAGEHHHEQAARITPEVVPIDFHGTVYEVVTTTDGREAWRHEHALISQLAFVRGTDVRDAPALARIGPEIDDTSPVRKRLCKTPRVLDVDAAGETIYALVVECSPQAPIRVVAYQPDRELRIGSVEELQLDPVALAVSRSGGLALAGMRAPGQLAIARVAADGKTTVTAHLAGVTRVHSAVVADDGAVWVLAFTSTGALVARDGVPVAVTGIPEHLAYEAKHGVIVLAAAAGTRYLLAERIPK